MKTQNKINSYGYAVYKHSKYHLPLFVLSIYSELRVGVYVFNNNADVNVFLVAVKNDLAKVNIQLHYDYDYDFTEEENKIISQYQNADRLFCRRDNKQMYIKY